MKHFYSKVKREVSISILEIGFVVNKLLLRYSSYKRVGFVTEAARYRHTSIIKFLDSCFFRSRWGVAFAVLFVFSYAGSNAQIPMNIVTTTTVDKPHAQVGDIVTYTINIVSTPDRDAVNGVIFAGCFGGSFNYDSQALGYEVITLKGLQVGNATANMTTPNIIAATIPVTVISNSISINDLFFGTNNTWAGFFGSNFSAWEVPPTTVTIKVRGTVLGTEASVVCVSSFELKNHRSGGSRYIPFEEKSLKSAAQTLIIPTVAPTPDVTLCNGTALSKTFTSTNPTTNANPAATVYRWATSNPRRQTVNGTSIGSAGGSTVTLVEPLSLASATSADYGEVRYTVTPTITAPVIDSQGNATGQPTTTIGDAISFTVKVYPVTTLTSISPTQQDGGQLLLKPISSISETTSFKTEFLWYGPNNPTMLMPNSPNDPNKLTMLTNTDGTLTLSNWQKGAIANTFYVVARNTYDYDGDGVFEGLDCTSNMLSITIKPLHLTLEANPKEVKEGSSGKFILRLVDSDGMPQGFNKDETLAITLRPDNEAKLGHYYFKTMEVPFSKMSTEVDIEVDALTDNIIYNTEMLRIRVACDDLSSATADLLIRDVTADDSKNTIITLEDGVIYNDEQIRLHAKLPKGILAGRDIAIELSDDLVKSDIAMLSSKPQFSFMVTIKAEENSAEFFVKSESNVSALPATLVLNGSVLDDIFYDSVIHYEVKDGTVIILNQKIHIPNIFTPNTDTFNDSWVIKSIEKYPAFTLEVFDEWGESVHSSSATNYKAWDGIYRGNPLPAGTYYYRIDLKASNKNKPYIGYVALIR